MAATHSIPPARASVTQETPAEAASGQRADSPPPTDAVVETATACICGHFEGAHEHYRKGTDCALCSCARFQVERRRRARGRRSTD